jgi:membrane protein implicated in regulation of membrane protease activity
MLIVALVLAVIGLAALVTAVVTSNELIAWVCIAASVIGVLLLIVDAVRERSRSDASEESAEAEAETDYVEDYPEEPAVAAETEAESDAETTAVTTEQREDDDRNGR